MCHEAEVDADCTVGEIWSPFCLGARSATIDMHCRRGESRTTLRNWGAPVKTRLFLAVAFLAIAVQPVMALFL